MSPLSRRSSKVAVAVALGLAGSPDPGRSQPSFHSEPCRAEVRVEPEHPVVGQQILYRLLILRREAVASVNWVQPLSFPSFRTEWLPGRAPDPNISGVGEGYLVFEERRALFASRAGTLQLSDAQLRCTVGRGRERRDTLLAVPEQQIEVDPLPEADRPPGHAGLVGRVLAQSFLSARSIRLGDSARLSVTLRGPANVWRAPAPEPSWPEVDVFAREPELQRDPGTRLVSRRSWSFDLVPRRTGLLKVPSFRFSYFEPVAGEYGVAQTEALELQVDPAPEPAVGGEPATSPPTSSTAIPPTLGTEPATPGAGWPLWAALLTLLASAGGALALWQRRRPRRAAAARELAEAAAAFERGDSVRGAQLLADALRQALDLRLPGSRSMATEEILTRVGDAGTLREAAELLQEIDRSRFGAGRAPAPDPERVRSTIRSLTGQPH